MIRTGQVVQHINSTSRMGVQIASEKPTSDIAQMAYMSMRLEKIHQLPH